MKISSNYNVSAQRQFPVSVSTLWGVAGHPAKVSWAVPMLANFRSPAKLQVGAPVAETHTILGLPQHYEGHITAYEQDSRWAMCSEPRGWGLFPLPHDVCYDFEGDEHGSILTLTCDFRCKGLLALPLVPRVVRRLMQRYLETMLKLVDYRCLEIAASHSVRKLANPA